MLPGDYEKRMREYLGDEFSLYEKELESPPVKALRVNTKVISAEKFKGICPFEISPVPYENTGFYFDIDNIGKTSIHHAGMIYVQEPGAMTPVSAVKIEENFKILDACASPGGKSTQAYTRLGNGGFIVSNEIVPSRCKILSGNFERMGMKNAVVISTDTKYISDTYENFFDLVIADAPCSGEGMFRKEKEAIPNWSLDNVKMCAERQSEILHNLSFCVKDGGKLLYSTCTFSMEENENTVLDFLKKHPEFSLISPADAVISATADGFFDSRMRRFYPHKSRGEGQFFAVMERHSDTSPSVNIKEGLKSLSKDEEKEILDFFRETLFEMPKEKLYKFKDNIILIDDNIPVDLKFTYSAGVTVGEAGKGYIKPHHMFFKAYGKLFKNQLDLDFDDVRVQKYLKGEVIPHNGKNGWYAITVNSVPLGGGKLSDGVIKNSYPKGLRNM